MKAKRLFALLLSFVMVISMLPGTALAAADTKIEIKAAEETLADKAGVAVELGVTTGATKIGMISAAVTYDKNVFELVDPNGAAVELPDVGTAMSAVQLVNAPAFEFSHSLGEDFVVSSLSDDLAGFTFVRISMMNNNEYAEPTTLGKVFLAYKDG